MKRVHSWTGGRSRRGKSRRSQRAYTIVELMMALAIFAVGITGVISMQKVTSSSNGHAKNLAIASHIAQSWLDALTVDATQWGQNDAGRTNTTWLKTGDIQSPPVWVVPAAQGTTFGPGFNALGSYTATAGDIAFCTNVRLSPLITTAGSQLIRTEVRVFWQKEGGGPLGVATLCALSVATVEAGTDRFHLVYKSSAVRQTAGNQ